MGDVAMIVPVLKAFNKTYPEIHLTVLSRTFFKPLFEDLKNITFLEADLEDKHKGIIGLLRLYKKIKSSNIDAVADLHNVIRSKILSKLLKLHGKKTSTLDKGRKEKKSLTRKNNKTLRQLKSTHQRYADVFESFGCPINLSSFESFSKTKIDNEKINIIFSKTKKIVGIAPFAAYKSKMYPLELMEEVIVHLIKNKELQIILIGGGQNEIEKLNLITKKYPDVINMAGKYKFKEELALISNLDLMVSMDSSNGHLAAIYGVPIVTLWGVTHPFLGFAPFGQQYKNSLMVDTEKFPLIPTSVYGNKYPENYEDAIKTITPIDVVNKVLTLVKS